MSRSLPNHSVAFHDLLLPVKSQCHTACFLVKNIIQRWYLQILLGCHQQFLLFEKVLLFEKITKPTRGIVTSPLSYKWWRCKIDDTKCCLLLRLLGLQIRSRDVPPSPRSKTSCRVGRKGNNMVIQHSSPNARNLCVMIDLKLLFAIVQVIHVTKGIRTIN